MLASVSVTCHDKKEAIKIAKVLLSKKLAACTNIWPVQSYYWWKKRIVKDQETILVIKTLSRHVPRIKTEIKKLHSYKVPVITIEKIEVNQEALNWVKEVVG